MLLIHLITNLTAWYGKAIAPRTESTFDDELNAIDQARWQNRRCLPGWLGQPTVDDLGQDTGRDLHAI